jgi:hypothetical protein
MKSEAESKGGDFFIFPSRSSDVDKLKDGDVTSKLNRVKNPLSFDQKMKFLHLFMPQFKDSIIDSKKENVVNIINAMVYIFEKKSSGSQMYNKVVVVVGDDRLSEMESLVTKYNGIEAKHGFYEFEEISVVSLSRDVSTGGDDISASKLRSLALNGNMKGFIEGCPSTSSSTDAEELYNTIRNIYRITENKSSKIKELVLEKIKSSKQLVSEEEELTGYRIFTVDSANKNSSSAGEKKFLTVMKSVVSNFSKIYGEEYQKSNPFTYDSKNSTEKSFKVKLMYEYDIKTTVDFLQKEYDVKNVKSTEKTSSVNFGDITINIQSGNGSRNNKAGGGKSGKKFEDELKQELEDFRSGVFGKYKKEVEEIENIINKKHDMSLKDEDVTVAVVGGKNQKRKPSYTVGSGITFGTSLDIGSTVTDVTIIKGYKEVYLSLKYSAKGSSSYYIINMSIREYLHLNKKDEDVKERNEILKYFGFSPKKFCEPYGLFSSDESVSSDSSVKENWKQILTQVIGKGYIYVVAGGHSDFVLDTDEKSEIHVDSIGQVLYAIDGVRKYSKITVNVSFAGKKQVLDCQFRGTTSSDKYPLYLRVLVK